MDEEKRPPIADGIPKLVGRSNWEEWDAKFLAAVKAAGMEYRQILNGDDAAFELPVYYGEPGYFFFVEPFLWRALFKGGEHSYYDGESSDVHTPEGTVTDAVDDLRRLNEAFRGEEKGYTLRRLHLLGEMHKTLDLPASREAHRILHPHMLYIKLRALYADDWVFTLQFFSKMRPIIALCNMEDDPMKFLRLFRNYVRDMRRVTDVPDWQVVRWFSEAIDGVKRLESWATAVLNKEPRLSAAGILDMYEAYERSVGFPVDH